MSHICLNPLFNSLDYLCLGSPKRQKVFAEAYKPISPSTGSRKKQHGKPCNSSAKDVGAWVKIRLPRRALPIPSTPISDSATSLSMPPSSTKGSRLDAQVVQHSTPSPASPLVADNDKHHHLRPPIPSTNMFLLVVIGHKPPSIHPPRGPVRIASVSTTSSTPPNMFITCFSPDSSPPHSQNPTGG